jgi:NADH:ubiquinone oxidoreductase subunit E
VFFPLPFSCIMILMYSLTHFCIVCFTTSYFATLDFEKWDVSKMATQKKHIEEIRRKKFSIGGNPNPLTEDLHHAVKNLSDELYTKDVHFLMELIQVPYLVTFSSFFFYTSFLTHTRAHTLCYFCNNEVLLALLVRLLK